MNPAGQPDPTTQYAQLKSAVLGAQQAGGASPLGNFPELSKLYGDLSDLQPKAQAVQGAAYNAQVEDANAKAAAARAASAQNAMLDPSKYQRVPAGDGGWNFIAPNGQQISANDYSRITGKSLDEVLKNSQNPIDTSFQEDYKNLNDYIKNKIASAQDPNSDAAKQVAAIEQKVKDSYGIDLKGAQISDVMNAFQQAYPTVFGGNKTGVPAGQTFIPTSQYGQANQNNAGGGIGG